MRRFFISSEQMGDNHFRIVRKEDVHHIADVLRLKKGDRIAASDGSGWEYQGRIDCISDDRIEAVIEDRQKTGRELPVSVTLFQGVPKGQKMETVIQKCTELGIDAVIPVFMDRTVVADTGNFDKKILRWQKIAEEAAKQCRRDMVPEIGNAIRFDRLPEQLACFDTIIFPYEEETGRTLRDCLQEALAERPEDPAEGRRAAPEAVGNRRRICMIIGPEGGFSPKEAASLKTAGADCVSLGPMILRTETAGPAAMAMILYETEL